MDERKLLMSDEKMLHYVSQSGTLVFGRYSVNFLHTIVHARTSVGQDAVDARRAADIFDELKIVRSIVA